MAVRGWGGTPATAFGIAAGAGAAQLGFGYGLGIISWTPPEPGVGGSAGTLWAASLGWATWIAATSTIAGAVGARRLARRPTAGAHARHRRPGGVPSALAAALGALVTVLLVAVPARAAVPTDTTAPQSMAAAYTGAGLLVGFLVAIWAQRSTPVAANIFASMGWLWALAVVAVVDGVLAGRGMASAQLGFWPLATDLRAGDHPLWLPVVLSLGSALVIGALAARRAARSTYRRVGAAASGAAGPLLVAVAYLLTVPRLPELRAEQLTAQFVAAYAVVTGIAGSVLVAALAQRRDAATATTAAAPEGDAAASADATGATAADSAAADARPADGAAADARTTTDPSGAEVGTAAPDGVEPPPVTGTVPPAGGSAAGAAELGVGAPAAPAPAPDTALAPAVDAGPARRRASRSTSKVPRQRREEPSTGAAAGTGAAEPPREPDPTGPTDDSGTPPAAAPATEPRARGRAATRRPRD